MHIWIRWKEFPHGLIMLEALMMSKPQERTISSS